MSSSPLTSFSVKVDLWVPGVVVCATFEHGDDMYYGALINTKLNDTFIENASDAVNTPLTSSLIFRSSYQQSESLNEAVPRISSSSSALPSAFKRSQRNRTSIKPICKANEKSFIGGGGGVTKQPKKRTNNIDNVSANLPVKRARKSNECSSVESVMSSRNATRNSSNSTTVSIQNARRHKKTSETTVSTNKTTRKQQTLKKQDEEERWSSSSGTQKLMMAVNNHENFSSELNSSGCEHSCLVSRTLENSEFSSDMESRTSLETYAADNEILESSEILPLTTNQDNHPLKLRLRSIDNNYEIAGSRTNDAHPFCSESERAQTSYPNGASCLSLSSSSTSSSVQNVDRVPTVVPQGSLAAASSVQPISVTAGAEAPAAAATLNETIEGNVEDDKIIPKMVVKFSSNSSSKHIHHNNSTSSSMKDNQKTKLKAASNVIKTNSTTATAAASTDVAECVNSESMMSTKVIVVESKTVHLKTSSTNNSKCEKQRKVYFESYPLSNGKILHIKDVVWAKLGRSPWWPARIQSIFSLNETEDVVVNVSWFGALTCSDLSIKSINLFKESFISRFQRKRKGSYRSAVRLAFSECPHISPEFNNDFDSFVNHCFGKRQNF